MQGKLFHRCSTHLLYSSVLSLGGNVNTRLMSQHDMESIFYIKNQWNILVIAHRKLLCELSKLLKLYKHWCIYSCLQIPPRENWFQYVRRVYATAINFPCIITLTKKKFCETFFRKKRTFSDPEKEKNFLFCFKHSKKAKKRTI